jgi:ribosomal protein S27E
MGTRDAERKGMKMKTVNVPADEVGIEITCNNCGTGTVFAIPQDMELTCAICGNSLAAEAQALDAFREFRALSQECRVNFRVTLE